MFLLFFNFSIVLFCHRVHIVMADISCISFNYSVNWIELSLFHVQERLGWIHWVCCFLWVQENEVLKWSRTTLENVLAKKGWKALKRGGVVAYWEAQRSGTSFFSFSFFIFLFYIISSPTCNPVTYSYFILSVGLTITQFHEDINYSVALGSISHHLL